MIGRFIKFVLSFLLAPLVGAFVYETGRFMMHNRGFQSLQWFLLGVGMCFLVYPIVRGDRAIFLERFEHEMGHSVVDGMTLRHFDEVRVSLKPNESYVRTHGPLNLGFVADLAPYYLPVLTLPLLIIRLIITALPTALVHPLIDVLIGLSLASHYVALLDEFGRKQDDIKRQGLLFSFLITLFANAFVLVIIWSGVIGKYGLVVGYLASSVERAIRFYEICMPLVSQAVAMISQL